SSSRPNSATAPGAAAPTSRRTPCSSSNSKSSTSSADHATTSPDEADPERTGGPDRLEADVKHLQFGRQRDLRCPAPRDALDPRPVHAIDHHQQIVRSAPAPD